MTTIKSIELTVTQARLLKSMLLSFAEVMNGTDITQEEKRDYQSLRDKVQRILFVWNG